MGAACSAKRSASVAPEDPPKAPSTPRMPTQIALNELVDQLRRENERLQSELNSAMAHLEDLKRATSSSSRASLPTAMRRSREYIMSMAAEPPPPPPSDVDHGEDAPLIGDVAAGEQSKQARIKSVSFHEAYLLPEKEAPHEAVSVQSPALAHLRRKLDPLERRRSFLSPSTSSLRRSNLGAMMQITFDTSNKSDTGEKPRILLYAPEDEVSALLEPSRYTVIHHSRLREALSELQMAAFDPPNEQPTVDLVMIDADTVGETNGWKLFDRVRKRYFPNELPVILLSTHTPMEEPRLLEANDHQQKPLEASLLRARTKNLVYLKKLNQCQTLFVPREFLHLLGCSTLTDIHLGNAVQKVMTVMFADIRSFTTLSEGMTPSENFSFINQYLSQIGPVVRRYGGFIDKFMGDGTIALFSTATDAVLGALEMQERVRDFSYQGRQISIGIGLNTGSVMLGIIGEDQRMSCDVISSAVNLASRLESLTKMYKCGLLASEETLAYCENGIVSREVDHVRVVGIHTSVKIFEILGPAASVSEERMKLKESYENARVLYCQRKFEAAREAFAKMKEADYASQVMHDRCVHFLANPPPEPAKWSDVWDWQQK